MKWVTGRGEWILAVQATLLESAGPVQRLPVSRIRGQMHHAGQHRMDISHADYKAWFGQGGPSLSLEPGQAAELEAQAQKLLAGRGPAGFAFRPTPRAAETNPRNPLHLDSIEGRTADNGSLKAGETV